MSEERKKQLVIGLLAAVVLVLVYQFVIKGPGGGAPAPASGGSATPAPPPLAASTPTPTAVDLDLDALEAGIRRVDFVYRNEKIDRDPMTPVRPILGETTAQGAVDPRINVKMQKIYDMKVTGIIYSDELRPMAIIDDELVTVGREYGDGVRIVAIDRDTVWFESDNARVPLKFKEQ